METEEQSIDVPDLILSHQYWASEAALFAWRRNPEHRYSQIQGIKKISTPGCRRYVPSDKIPRVLNGMGISILSTSKGVVSNKKAEALNVGGEVLCQVW